MFSNYIDVQGEDYGEHERLREGVFLFETAFEIANPIGGINTVLRTKTPSLLKRLDISNYAMLGLWPGENKELAEVKEDDKEGESLLFKTAFMFSKVTGINVKCGKWLIQDLYSKDKAICPDCCPNVVLFDPGEYDTHKGLLSQARYSLWKKYKLHFPEFPEEHNRFRFYSLVSGVFVSIFVIYASKIILEDKNNSIKEIILHSHEWCGGVAQILLSCRADPLRSVEYENIYSKVRYVFTTHATILGRCLSAAGVSVEQLAPKTYTDQQLYDFADQHGVTLEYGVERLCAETANVFTTVSEVTAKEAMAILHVEPHIITINGSFAIDARKLKGPKKEQRYQEDYNTADNKQLHINIPDSGINSNKGINSNNSNSSDTLSGFSSITSEDLPFTKSRFSTSSINVVYPSRHSSELINFIKNHFSGIHCANIDTNNMIVVMCCGRNEIVNKGFDVFLHSLSLLNKKLKRWKMREIEEERERKKKGKKAGSDTDTLFGSEDTEKEQDTYKNLRGCETSFDSVLGKNDKNAGRIKDNLGLKRMKMSREVKKTPTVIGILISPTQANEEYPKEVIKYKGDKEKTFIFDKRYSSKYISTLDSLYESRLITHKLHNPWKEEILQKAINYKLNKSSPTTSTYFVWIPQFLPIPEILPLTIRQLYDNIDLGAFPSKYEPWGYTPIECAESGAPSITTNLAGSGCFFDVKTIHPEGWRACDTGILVIDRKYSSSDEASVRLCDAMFDFLTLNDAEKLDIARKCKRSIKLISWDKIITNYIIAYNSAAAK